MSYLYRIKYRKNGPLKFISHLDLNLLLRRILLRAKMPVELTQGYNPRIKVSFGPALPLGVEGWQEIMEITLTELLAKEKLKDEINKAAPSGFQVLEIEQVVNKGIPLSKLLKYASYLIYLIFINNMEKSKKIYYRNKIDYNIKYMLNKGEIKTIKETKKGLKEIDLRPYIHKMTILPNSYDEIIIDLILNIKSGECINPNLIINSLIDDVKESFLIEKIIREKIIIN